MDATTPATPGEPAPAEGAPAEADPASEVGDKPAEGGDAAPADGLSPADETPDAKKARELVTQANRTMAAARRVEKETKAALAAKDTEVAARDTKITAIETELGTYREFYGQIRTNLGTALARAGYRSVEEVLDAINKSGDVKPPDPYADRFARLEAENEKLRKEREAEQKASHERQTQESRRNVHNYLDNEITPEGDAKFPLASTSLGKQRVWDAVIAYGQKHGSIPDEAIYAIAGKVEAALKAEGLQRSVPRRDKQKNGAAGDPDAANKSKGAPGVKPGGTIKNTSGPPSRPSMLPEDIYERNAQVVRDMRAESARATRQ